MQIVMRFSIILVLAFGMMSDCSQKSETDPQAKSSAREAAQPATLQPAEKEAVQQPQAPVALQPQAPAVQQQEEIQATVQQEPPVAEQQEEFQANQMDQAAQQPQEDPGASSEPADAQIDEISGTVVKIEEGIFIFSDSGNYIAAGQDLTDLVGKNVKVTGMIDEISAKPVITVTSVSVIE